MEPVSADSSQVPAADPSLTGRPRASRPTPPELRVVRDLGVEHPVAVRLGLQRRAPINLRRHFERAVIRFTVLVAADLAVFALMRALIRSVRDSAALGPGVAGWVGGVVPRGHLNGWQFAVALFVGLLVMGTYGQGDRRRDPRRLFAACALATALPLWMTIWTRGLEPVLVQYAATVVLLWLGLVAERRVIDQVVAWVRRGSQAAATLFVGPAEDCRRAMAGPAFEAGVGSEHRPVGFVDLAEPAAPDALGWVGEFSEVLARTGSEAVVVCGPLNDTELREVVDTALTAGCQVLSPSRAAEFGGLQPVVVWRGGQPLIELTAPGLKGWQLVAKRALDLVGASVGLALLSPVFAAIAVLVTLESRGPVLYAQERVGLGGRRFRMLKFRTMVDGADADQDMVAHLNRSGDGRLFKIPEDPRVTRPGGWLRRWSLDELPQLYNVLVGDMSLVGPRPFFERDLPHYEPHHFSRLGVKPGMTGLWQVSGRSDIVAFEDVIALDTRYVREWSVFLDLAILLRTLPAVARRHGAV